MSFEISNKPLRKISLAGCEVIGRGAIGTVYRIDDETIVKVYEKHVPLETIERERLSARAAFLSGLPCAITFDTVDADGKFGIVYELFKAQTLATVIMNDTENIKKYAADAAQIALKMHNSKAEGVSSVKELWLSQCDEVRGKLPEGETEKMRTVIESIPDGETFVHGDFHPKNIMVQNGEYLLIDMGDIGFGNPAFDLAVIKTCLDISAKHMPPEIVMSAYGMTREICDEYYKAFCESYGGEKKLWENALKLSDIRHTLWRAINNRDV